jgi:hypothetical protein
MFPKLLAEDKFKAGFRTVKTESLLQTCYKDKIVPVLN